MFVPIVLFAFAIMVSPVCALAQAVPQPSSALHQLYIEDQNDQPAHTPRSGPSEASIKDYEERGVSRRASVQAMLAHGQISSPNDLYEAAFIFQHGESAADYLLAHVLALDAVTKGYDRAKWLSVATLDRYLQLIGQPQIFGTQFPFDSKLPHPVTNGGRFSGRTQEPFDENFLPAHIRIDFCVPDLQQQEKNLQTLNSGTYPRATMTIPNCSR